MTRTIGPHALKRYLTLKTHKIRTMPVAILMPHSSCNCRCVMCDIWRGNSNLQQLTEADIQDLLLSLKQLDTRWVVMSGGEALMNPGLFRLCALLRQGGIHKITILSTGLLLKKYAQQVVEQVDEVIISLDGPEEVHDTIRRIPHAYQKLREGVQAVRAIQPNFSITGRCVIQRLNFAHWPAIVDAAHDISLDQISFLAADVSSEAFNRPQLWDDERVEEVNLRPEQLPQMHAILEQMIHDYAADFTSHYIAESPDKLRRIYNYYAALHNQGEFPAVRCNAPWVSTVVESDGTVRPCYFHEAIGNIRQTPLAELLNTPSAVAFRQQLDMDTDPICRKCVCSLNLRPTVKVG